MIYFFIISLLAYFLCNRDIYGLVLGLWCLMPLSTICQLYRGHQFYWWRKLEYPQKTINLSQVTDKLYHMMLYTPPPPFSSAGFELTNLVGICTDCTRSCKSKYPAITKGTATIGYENKTIHIKLKMY